MDPEQEVNEKGLHTIPQPGGRWANRLDGALITRHRDREDAIAAGAATAQVLAEVHVIHGEDGGVESTSDYREAPHG